MANITTHYDFSATEEFLNTEASLEEIKGMLLEGALGLAHVSDPGLREQAVIAAQSSALYVIDLLKTIRKI